MQQPAKNRGRKEKILIDLTQQTDKLLFTAMRPRLSVIANQSADWCGNPPVREEMYRQLPYRVGNVAIFGGNRYLVPFNGGIATPVCALARNDSVFRHTRVNINLSMH